MNKQEQEEVKKILKDIRGLKVDYDNKFKALKSKLLSHVVNFDTYLELYMFVKSNTPDLETFNLDMFDAMQVFDKKK